MKFNLTSDELAHVGNLLGYTPQAAKRKASRFILGLQGKLKNWDYEETINFGDMHKVLSIIQYLNLLST